MKEVFDFFGLLNYNVFEYNKLNLGYYFFISKLM